MKEEEGDHNASSQDEVERTATATATTTAVLSDPLEGSLV